MGKSFLIDKSGANQAGINDHNDNHGIYIEIRQVKVMNNIVEADYGRIKRRIRSMRGFKSFWSAKILLAGVELIQMLRKGQMKMTRGQCTLSFAEKFNLLAA